MHYLPIAVRNKFDELQKELNIHLKTIHYCTMHSHIHLM